MMAYGLWPRAFGLWCLAPGLWPMAPCLWVMAYGSWPMAYGLWLLAYGLWLLASGFWLLAYANSSSAQTPMHTHPAPPPATRAAQWCAPHTQAKAYAKPKVHQLEPPKMHRNKFSISRCEVCNILGNCDHGHPHVCPLCNPYAPQPPLTKQCHPMMASGLWQLASGSWLMASGAWLLAYGSLLMARGSWPMTSGLWPLAPGLWRLALWLLASGPWPVACGLRLVAYGLWHMACGNSNNAPSTTTKHESSLMVCTSHTSQGLCQAQGTSTRTTELV